MHTVADIDTGGGRQLYFSAPFFLPFSPAVVVQSKIRRKEERKVKQANKVEHKCKVSECPFANVGDYQPKGRNLEFEFE